MSNKKSVLKIFSLTHPLLSTERWSIFGDKYCHALPFDYEMTDSLEDASVVLWDGIITLKQSGRLAAVEAELQKAKVLLIIGQVQNLYQDHSLVNFFDPTGIATVYLTGWSILPEEFLAALEVAYQKIIHV